MSVLITGGARSGKSSFAEKWCMRQGHETVYIATGQAFDGEMRRRIDKHRDRRERTGYSWRTLEEPLLLAGLLRDLSRAGGPVALVDCLTLWLSNQLLQAEQQHGLSADCEQAVEREIEELSEAVRNYPGPLALVTNEVGSGIVPEYPLGRLYRDLAGIMNRRLAENCSEVFLVTAGIPIELKRLEYKL